MTSDKPTPHAYILSGSTAGEIFKTRVYDNSLVATAIWFENTVLKPAHLKIGKTVFPLERNWLPNWNRKGYVISSFLLMD